ncbi:DUF192 domain-containing protein [Confluentibacter flavum]|uniref:DUF192 domain-containing protein n=1 Tax=Confluentibacter flavum TaxID=1909700 RepID=A0A2N3HIF1_9FLAO|nr:DUF192 domain-containing protein [Confluentibacter flavum]PKQ44736.1 hypothetical protein CSW08_11500 [Confluentibacter flavum]
MYLKKNIVVYLSLGMLLHSISGCKDEKKSIKQTEVTFTKEGDLTIFKIATDSTEISLDIEIADTDYDIQTGLMYRSSMKTNQGMLFVFDDVRERYFFMKNTQIPLDIIYIDDNKKIVSYQKDAKPFDETSLPSNIPAKYVLEVNAGLVDTWLLKEGDSLSW